MNKVTHEQTTFILKSDLSRVLSQYDDAPAMPRLPRTSEGPERIVLETVINPNGPEPQATWPVAVVYRNSYFEESEDGKSHGEGSSEDYVVPVMTYELVSQLEGRLLDYIDAAYADKDQRNAQKRVVRKTLWGFYDEAKAQFKQQFDNSGLKKIDKE